MVRDFNFQRLAEFPGERKLFLEKMRSAGEAYLSEAADLIEEWLGESEVIKVKTSGSTGVPQEITLRKEHIRKSVRKTAAALQLPPGISAFTPLPVSYIAGKLMWIRAVELRWHLYASTPAATPECPEHRTHFTAMTPHQCLSLLNAGTNFHEQFGKILLGGGVVSETLIQRLGQQNVRGFAGYGMTETITHIALSDLSEYSGEIVYTALPEVSIETDHRGCLAIHIPYFDDLFIQTNDLVEIKDARRFVFRGRFDRVINSGGRKISPEDLEARLRQNIRVPFYFCAKPDEVLGEKMVLMIEAGAGVLDAVLANEFSGWDAKDRPKETHYRDEFRRTHTGKVIQKYYE